MFPCCLQQKPVMRNKGKHTELFTQFPIRDSSLFLPFLIDLKYIFLRCLHIHFFIYIVFHIFISAYTYLCLMKIKTSSTNQCRRHHKSVFLLEEDVFFSPPTLASCLNGIKDAPCSHPVKRPVIPTQASRGAQNSISLIQLIELITISNSSVVMNLYSGAFNGAPYRLVRKTVLKSTRVNFLRSR